MSRRAASVTQADIARAIRAAKQVGDGYCVEIAPGGLIRIVKGGPGFSTEPPASLPDPVAPERKWRI